MYTQSIFRAKIKKKNVIFSSENYYFYSCEKLQYTYCIGVLSLCVVQFTVSFDLSDIFVDIPRAMFGLCNYNINNSLPTLHKYFIMLGSITCFIFVTEKVFISKTATIEFNALF